MVFGFGCGRIPEAQQPDDGAGTEPGLTEQGVATEVDVGESADSLVRTHFQVAAWFLVVGALAGLLLAIQLSAPDLLTRPFRLRNGELLLNTGFLSFGRLTPVFTGAMLFGWLTIALIGAIYYLMPRLTGASVQGTALARAGLLLLAAGVGGGVVTAALGEGQSRVLFEFPWYSDIAVILGVAAAAIVVTRTAMAHREPRLYVSVYYFVAALWWLLFSYVIGSLGFFQGTDLALANRFAEGGVLFMWVLPAGIGIAYYLIPKLANSPLFSERLAMIGFWTQAGAFAWVGMFSFTFGPGPDWLETITGVFAIAVLVPVMTIVTCLLLTVDWSAVRSSVSLKLTLAGIFFFALLVIQIPAMAFRSSSTIVQFTSWTEATFVICVIGAGTLWVLALAHTFVEQREAEAQLMLVAGGSLVLVGTMWLGGLLSGFTMASSSSSQEFVNFGEGFVNVIAQGNEFNTVRWIAWAVIALGLILFAIRMLMPHSWSFEPVLPPTDGADPVPGDLRPGQIVVAAGMVMGLAFLVLVVTPALDSSDEQASLLAVASRDYDSFADGTASEQARSLFSDLGLDAATVADGREVYTSEGCIYCHTQQVRANVTDVGLGAVTRRQDIIFENPLALGRLRVGPDLAHAGRRDQTDDVGWVKAHLSDPRENRGWSVMPSYDYLTDSELEALAQYVVSLQ